MYKSGLFFILKRKLIQNVIRALGRVSQCPFRLRISHISVPFGDFNLFAVLYALDRVADERAKEIDRYAPIFQ